MNTFHHGGRIGDLIFALYAMKQLGGGELFLSDYHHPNWDLRTASSLQRLLLQQPYIKSVHIVPYGAQPKAIDYDLQKAEDDYNPEDFPEWTREHWPGNCNIVKRYAVHFGVPYPPSEPWLTAVHASPHYFPPQITVHLPAHRLVRHFIDWQMIIKTLEHRAIVHVLTEYRDPYITAMMINSSHLFLGAVSSCNAIAEALGKPTYVEQADGCFNVNPTLSLNGMSNNEVVEKVMESLNACKP